MGTISRFESLSPTLAEAYRQANDDQRRRAALAICLFALDQAELQGDEVNAALSLLRRGAPGSSDMQQKLERLAAELDERYFELSDDTENITPEAFVMFQKARAAAALAFALSPNGEELHEAIYEAISTSDDPDDQDAATQAAEAMLRAK
jgi:hypothetical protein